ncbi:MAG: transglycosylase SLT domain-containing protein, partial [Ignavibacteriae bacterium]|nr:transglycosylase SLT domain-containing protein [Ignavibacteriota bacterium]
MAKKKKDGYLFAGLMFLAAIPIMGGSKKNPPAPVPPKNPSLPPGDIYDVILKKESAKYGLDYRILKAIMAIESDYGRTNWYVTKTSGSGGAAGLFAITDIARTQVNQNLGTKFTRNDLWKPEISIICAANLIDY